MTSAAPTTPAEYWDKYKRHRGEGDRPRPTTRAFGWTGLADGGPGAEVLGTPATALDLGPAEGENAAYLARVGVEVTAVDFSAVQVERARRFWADEPRLTFVHAVGGKWLEGRETELTVWRWQYGSEQWADILKRHNFTAVDAKVLPNPDPAVLGTLLVTATTTS
ncbi:class I SAM-dependent methyltransferase [Streptomyces sp. NPDC059534]|uniref:class I SAM-dependent methyltransferase n=1 Tax=Streptomyces sp. NPDC059534 TaxID=3346859 RepID=UPI00369FBEE3